MTRREAIRAANMVATVLSIISLVVLMVVRTPEELTAPVSTARATGAADAAQEPDAGDWIRRLRAGMVAEAASGPSSGEAGAVPSMLGMIEAADAGELGTGDTSGGVVTAGAHSDDATSGAADSNERVVRVAEAAPKQVDEAPTTQKEREKQADEPETVAKAPRPKTADQAEPATPKSIEKAEPRQESGDAGAEDTPSKPAQDPDKTDKTAAPPKRTFEADDHYDDHDRPSSWEKKRAEKAAERIRKGVERENRKLAKEAAKVEREAEQARMRAEKEAERARTEAEKRRHVDHVDHDDHDDDDDGD